MSIFIDRGEEEFGFNDLIQISLLAQINLLYCNQQYQSISFIDKLSFD